MKTNPERMRAVFLDRDGTINVDHGYVYRISDFEFTKGAIEGLKEMQDAGLTLFIITDQSGIGRGYYTHEDFRKITSHLVAELEKNGIRIKKTYYCPHSPEDNCECRKPNTKMLLDAKNEYGIELEKSYVIGDKESDILAGKRAGCKTILVLTGQTRDPDECRTKPDFVAKDLIEAAGIIKKDIG